MLAEVMAVAVMANGNLVTGGLSFSPTDVTTRVGGEVTWTNTDVIAPHTATEANKLWELTGNDNGTPVSPPGFGPGKTLGRAFEAGTFSYFCVVHPEQMKGTVSVPVSLSLKGKRKHRKVLAQWAAAAPVSGEVFDAEFRRDGKGAWKTLATGTTALSSRKLKAGKKGTVTAVRARLRFDDGVDRASGWSPVEQITAR
jgi:plastocyanin